MSELQIRDFSSYTDLLPVQFSDSENLIKLLSIYLDQVEELNLAQQALGEFSTELNTAFGYQLDIIGALLGVSRLGLDDEEFRDAIRFGISRNTGSGTPEDVIGFLQTITKATKVRYWEHYPACTVLETNGTNIPKAIPATMDNVTPAGVRTGGIIVVEDDVCLRPCRLSEAFANRVFVGNPPSTEYQMGDSIAEMGESVVEMAGNFSSEYYFEDVAEDTLLGNSILPELTDAYDITPLTENEMGNTGIEMGVVGVEMDTLEREYTQKEGFRQGRCANILTDRS
tara:strand:+ start:49045 stop:49896 length:852 start_codon:yes stop_codon:yes gene_type:complete